MFCKESEDRILTTNKGLDLLVNSNTLEIGDGCYWIRLQSYLLDKHHEIAHLEGIFNKQQVDLFCNPTYNVSDNENLDNYFLNILEIEKEFWGNGIGSKLIDLSKFSFAKFLEYRGEIEGLIDGYAKPLDPELSHKDLNKFYIKNGFEVNDGKISQIINANDILSSDMAFEFEPTL